eukprot:jgi/Mesvir1/12595/Mv17925-RA.3
MGADEQMGEEMASGRGARGGGRGGTARSKAQRTTGVCGGSGRRRVRKQPPSRSPTGSLHVPGYLVYQLAGSGGVGGGGGGAGAASPSPSHSFPGVATASFSGIQPASSSAPMGVGEEAGGASPLAQASERSGAQGGGPAQASALVDESLSKRRRVRRAFTVRGAGTGTASAVVLAAARHALQLNLEAQRALAADLAAATSALDKNRRVQAALQGALDKTSRSAVAAARRRAAEAVAAKDAEQGQPAGDGAQPAPSLHSTYFAAPPGHPPLPPLPGAEDWARVLSAAPCRYATKAWSAAESDELAARVKEQVVRREISRHVAVLRAEGREPVDRKEVEQLARDVTRTCGDAGRMPELFAAIDWAGAAADLGPSSHRTADDCRIHWHAVRDPRLKPGRWSKEEDRALLRAVTAHGQRDWVAISNELSTVASIRTPAACLHRYQLMLHPGVKTSAWNHEEEAQMAAALEADGRLRNWGMVAKGVPGRTPEQCARRYRSKQRLARAVAGHWSRGGAEDLALAVGVAVCGAQDWLGVARHVPGRNDMQCRERWFNAVSPDVRAEGWSDVEMSALFRAVSRHGVGNWTKVAAEVPGRTDDMCRRKWNSTAKWDKQRYQRYQQMKRSLLRRRARSEMDVEDVICGVTGAGSTAALASAAKRARPATPAGNQPRSGAPSSVAGGTGEGPQQGAPAGGIRALLPGKKAPPSMRKEPPPLEACITPPPLPWTRYHVSSFAPPPPSPTPPASVQPSAAPAPALAPTTRAAPASPAAPASRVATPRPATPGHPAPAAGAPVAVAGSGQEVAPSPRTQGGNAPAERSTQEAVTAASTGKTSGNAGGRDKRDHEPRRQGGVPSTVLSPPPPPPPVVSRAGGDDAETAHATQTVMGKPILAGGAHGSTNGDHNGVVASRSGGGARADAREGAPGHLVHLGNGVRVPVLADAKGGMTRARVPERVIAQLARACLAAGGKAFKVVNGAVYRGTVSPHPPGTQPGMSIGNHGASIAKQAPRPSKNGPTAATPPSSAPPLSDVHVAGTAGATELAARVPARHVGVVAPSSGRGSCPTPPSPRPTATEPSAARPTPSHASPCGQGAASPARAPGASPGAGKGADGALALARALLVAARRLNQPLAGDRRATAEPGAAAPPQRSCSDGRSLAAAAPAWAAFVGDMARVLLSWPVLLTLAGGCGGHGSAVTRGIGGGSHVPDENPASGRGQGVARRVGAAGGEKVGAVGPGESAPLEAAGETAGARNSHEEAAAAPRACEREAPRGVLIASDSAHVAGGMAGDTSGTDMGEEDSDTDEEGEEGGREEGVPKGRPQMEGRREEGGRKEGVHEEGGREGGAQREGDGKEERQKEWGREEWGRKEAERKEWVQEEEGREGGGQGEGVQADGEAAGMSNQRAVAMGTQEGVQGGPATAHVQVQRSSVRVRKKRLTLDANERDDVDISMPSRKKGAGAMAAAALKQSQAQGQVAAASPDELNIEPAAGQKARGPTGRRGGSWAPAAARAQVSNYYTRSRKQG